MNIAERDLYLLQIEKEIKIRRKRIFDNQIKIQDISKQNQFLNIVKNDYYQYYNTIIQQKQDQLKALELLNQYIEDLSFTGKLSKQNIKDSLYEQKKIFFEIKKIKRGLDELIQFNQKLV
jgi:cell division septum initiation protein DivIVA